MEERDARSHGRGWEASRLCSREYPATAQGQGQRGPDGNRDEPAPRSKVLRAVGEGLAEALDVGFAFGFDHDAGELLGAGVAKDDPAIIAKCGLGFG
jgi:hypothetical protein